MKILILGSHGMLGTDLMSVFRNEDPIGFDINELDITKSDKVNEKLNEIRPILVINAAAYTKVDDCESNQALAYEVNGQAVGNLAKACRQIGATLVHYSTDYIFDGRKKTGYLEDDPPKPLNVYGKSKLLGEKLLETYHDHYYLLRTAWLYGKNGPNFIRTMIEKSNVEKELKVVDDQHGSPTYTLDLARKTREIIQQKMPYGKYHVTNCGDCTWYQYARKIFEILGKDVKIRPIKSEDFPRPAKRPKFSILKSQKIASMRPWDEALKDYLSTNA